MTNQDFDSTELFMNELISYMNEYQTFLESKYSKNTVTKHISIIHFFIDHINAYYLVKGFEEITLGMCGSKMVRSYNSNCCESLQNNTAKKILYSFFLFIYEKHSIVNHNLLNGLKKR